MSTLFEHVSQRLLGMETERLSWWAHWRELADYMLPRRYKWLITPNEMNRGSPINGRIIDNTATIAARTLAAGLMAGITSPTRPWFKLRIESVSQDTNNPINRWLAECERRMFRVMSESNFYNGMGVLWTDLSVFNTATMLIYEDFDDVIRCFNPCAGEYYLENGPRMNVDVFYRKFVRNVSQIVQEFGYDNCPETVRKLWDQKGASFKQEFIIAHAIEPNTPRFDEIPSSFKFRECYWVWGGANGTLQSAGQNSPQFLRCKGFHELPGLFPRWDIVANDAYGRGPSMDALGDTKQLQQEQKRKAQAIDKMTNPPMIADVQLKNQPMSLLPGGVTYASGMSTAHSGMRPVYQVMPPVRELMEDIAQVQLRIKNTYFNDLFMMFQQMQAEPRSAAAIDARREEKLVMLGPVFERVQTEALDVAIDRVFNIMQRAGLIPPAPPEVQGQPIEIVYVSIIAEAQRAVATAAIERTYAFAGNLAGVAPDIMDNLDSDETIQVYSDMLAADPRIMRDPTRVAAIRKQRLEQEQAMQAMQMTDAGAKAAKTMSETDTGGGANLLQNIIGAAG